MKRKILICDIDGCLSNDSQRQKDLREHLNMDTYHSQLGHDPCNVIIADIINAHGYPVLLTARPESLREATIAWLTKWDVRYHTLVMRPDVMADLANDLYRNSCEWKSAILDHWHNKGDTIELFIDNDPLICQVATSMNIPTMFFHQENKTWPKK